MKIFWNRSIGYNIDHWKNYYKRDKIWYMRIARILPSGEQIEHRGSRWVKMTHNIIENGAGCYPWREYFAFFPKKTITGKRVFWQRAYKRRVWVVWGAGFHMESKIQYGTIFDLLKM